MFKQIFLFHSLFLPSIQIRRDLNPITTVSNAFSRNQSLPDIINDLVTTSTNVYSIENHGVRDSSFHTGSSVRYHDIVVDATLSITNDADNKSVTTDFGDFSNDTSYLFVQDFNGTSAFVNDNRSYTSRRTVDLSWQVSLSTKLIRYVSPVLIVAGTVGNFVAVVTLQSRLFKSSSTSFLLSALALADIGVLNTGFMRVWIYGLTGIDVRTLSSYGCKFHVLFTYFFHQLASWTLILTTFERSLAVYFPFRSKVLCKRRRFVIAWTTTAVGLFGLNLHFLFGWELQRAPGLFFCSSKSDWVSFYNSPYMWVDIILADLLPFAVVFIGNILLVVKIIWSNHVRSKNLNNGAASSAGKTSTTTFTLILVSVIFLVFCIPYDVANFGYNYGWFPVNSNDQFQTKNLISTVVVLLSNTNNAVEFILYFFSGRKFRNAFIDVFSCAALRRNGVQTSVVTVV